MLLSVEDELVVVEIAEVAASNARVKPGRPAIDLIDIGVIFSL